MGLTVFVATLSVPEGPHANDEKFFQRLEMHGAPWCIDLPKEALGGLWVAKPSEMMSPEGFPSEVRVSSDLEICQVDLACVTSCRTHAA